MNWAFWTWNADAWKPLGLSVSIGLCLLGLFVFYAFSVALPYPAAIGSAQHRLRYARNENERIERERELKNLERQGFWGYTLRALVDAWSLEIGRSLIVATLIIVALGYGAGALS